MLKDFNPAEKEFELDIPETLASPESLGVTGNLPVHEELPASEENLHPLTNPTASRHTDAEFFRNLTLEWLEAWKTRNVDNLNQRVAENFCFVSRRVKNMAIDKTGWRRMVTEQYTLQKYEVEFINIQVHEYAAVVVYQLTMMVQPSFSNLPEKFIVTDTWTLIDGEWKTMSRQPLPV